MNRRLRRVVVAVGVAALVGSVVTIASADGRVADVPTDLLTIGGTVFAAAMTVVLYRTWFAVDPIASPGVERAVDHPAPGEAFDRTLAQFDGTGRGNILERNGLHERLCELAVTIQVRQGCSREEALDAVERGDWPDDPMVAAFLRNPDVEVPRSWTDRVRALVGDDEVGPSDFQQLARRTVDALASRSELVAADDESALALDDFPDRERTAPRLDDVRSSGTDTGAAVLGTVATGRWRAVVPVALAFVGFGVAVQRAAVILAGVVALGFAVYARAFVPPTTSLVVERSIDADRPTPGDDVEITTTVRNEGDRALVDLRVIDGVPRRLAVSEGSPRHRVALRPGESTSFTYSVTARRGHHGFDPVHAVVRDRAGTTGRVTLEPTARESDTALDCVPRLDGLPVAVPLYEQSGQYLGRLPAAGGDGVAFHATRAYQPGDPSSRIDWKRLARSPNDELTTVEYREERAATVALVIDASSTAYLAPTPDDPGAVERSIEAAGRLFTSLLDVGDRVGVAALGPTPLWVDPGTGVDHRERVEEILATHRALPPTAPDDGTLAFWARDFHRRFPAETQVVLLSPLCHPRNRFLIRQLRAYGHPVTVVSPDPTVDETVGQRLARVERRQHVETLRESGIRVVDWDPTVDLAVAMERAATRWSG